MLINLERASEILGRNIDEVRKLAKKGVVPGYLNLSGHWRFSEEAIEIWKELNPKQSYKLSDLDFSNSRYDNMTLKEIGDELGVSSSSIGYHLRRLGRGRRGR